MAKTVIHQLNIGKPKKYYWRKMQEHSAIGKEPTEEAMLLKGGFAGDDVANHEYHGGEDRAVCLYPYEHYASWEKEFNTALVLPAFGENITPSGMLEKDIYIGDVFELGEAVIEVTQGRIPCSTISKHNGVDPILSRLVETGFTGYFFRVKKEGAVSSNSSLALIDRVQEQFSVLRANQMMFHEREKSPDLERILQVPALAEDWRKRFCQFLDRRTKF
ncbi:MOSC domain-containing protein [Mesobacillus foraminis]|uniref:MOSC domain-containing protein YiiM n=1 Tax=Mesobacillus foraminis TaxID=279826 RepID=A0A4R2BF08_9BACI|nr:MOSC domain-containing protein [Mesobacillus foraminis]TCN24892.1 MOSC domain-containing protein YiiM [Mesobacillus foraminis]